MKKNDPKKYHRLSAPHPSPEAANKALTDFYEAIGKAREEYNISDVLIVIKDSAIYEDGNVGDFMQTTQLGNQLNGAPMAAYAYGQQQAEQRELLNKLAAGTK